MGEHRFYVYAHFTCDTDEVFYIGKGTNKRCSSLKARSKFWQAVAMKHGFYFCIITRGTEKHCLNEERRLIKKIGRRDLGTGPLVNLTDGGDGMLSPSQSVRDKWAATRTGRRMPEEQRATRRGKKSSDEARWKISKGLKAHKRTEEHKKNLRGLKRSAETCKRISAATSGPNNPSSKPIILTHPDGTEEFFTFAKAAIDKYGLHQSEVSKCCRGVRSSHRGFHIRYANV